MCSLCGILGCDDHWTSAVARDGTFSRNQDSQSRRREAADRRRVINKVLATRRIVLDDWHGSYILTTATGRTQVFDSLGHLWSEAEALAGAAFDPLDPVLLARMNEKP